MTMYLRDGNQCSKAGAVLNSPLKVTLIAVASVLVLISGMAWRGSAPAVGPALAATLELPTRFAEEGELTRVPQDIPESISMRELLITGLKQSQSLLRAGDFRFEIVESVFDPEAPSLSELFYRQTRWAFDGEKCRSEIKLSGGSVDGIAPRYEVVAAYDGVLSSYYYPSESKGARVFFKIGHLVKAVEPVLMLLTDKEKPLGETFQSAVYEGEQRIGNVQCHKLSYREPYAQSSVDDGVRVEVWLSPEHGYMAKRLTLSRERAGIITNRTVIDVDSFTLIEPDVWLPMSGRRGDFQCDGDSQACQLMRSVGWRLADYKLTASADVFAVAFPPTVSVEDSVADVNVVPPKRSD